MTQQRQFSERPRQQAPVLLYILHSGNLYGTERMALATLEGMNEYTERVVFAPPGFGRGSVGEAALEAGFHSVPFGSRLSLLRALVPWFMRYRSIDVMGTGVVHSVLCHVLSRLFRVRLRQLHVAHGGTAESLDRKRVLNRIPVVLVAVSDFVREKLIERGVLAEKITVIENFLSKTRRQAPLTRPPYDPAIEGARPIDPRRVRVIIVSRLDAIKRIDLLVDSDIPEKFPDFQFDICGTGDQIDILKARAASFSNLRLNGFVDNVEQRLAEADILLHLCPEEPFGLAILEAYQARLIVIGPDSGGAGQLIDDGVTGLHFTANSAQDLARVLGVVRKMVGSQLQRMADAGTQKLDKQFTEVEGVSRYRRAIELAGARVSSVPATSSAKPQTVGFSPRSSMAFFRRSERALLYILHSGNFYGTERMALATLEGMTEYDVRVVVAPKPLGAASVASEAVRAGYQTAVFHTRWQLMFAVLPWFLRYRTIDVIGVGVGSSIICHALGRLLLVKLRQLQVAHGGTSDGHAYGSKHMLNHIPIGVVAVSDFVRRKLLEHGVRHDSISVIENFLPDTQLRSGLQRPSYDPNDQPARALDLRSVKVAIVSRVDKIKRIDVLLDAIERHGLSEFVFDIYGTGEELEATKARSEQMTNVHFHGFAADVHERLPQADILLHLCPEEPFGLVVLEAFLSRLLVVVPDAGGAGSLVQNGITGLRFQANDVDDLARTLHAARAADPAKLQQLVRAGAAELEHRFGQVEGVQRYREALEASGTSRGQRGLPARPSKGISV